ncbi:MAG TPA: primosomal protein N' [Rhodospirillaceae bacterium]|nr:primosomal protein N' [Rhodospirillaceae bacterium]
MDSLFQDEELGPAPKKDSRPPSEVRSVLVPYPVDKAYDYGVPEGMDVQDGDYVCVPLGGREVPAVVWGQGAGDVKPEKLKYIIDRYDAAPMRKVHRDFISWAARYCAAPIGSVLKMALSVPAGLEPPAPARGFQLADGVSDARLEKAKLSVQRRAVMDVMADGQIRRASEIAEVAGCSASVVKGLSDKGFLKQVDIFNPVPCKTPNYKHGAVDLSEDQQDVAERLCEQIGDGGYYCNLLDGVTGAGKTEVYFEAIAKALEQGKQILLLLPEIALSNAFLQRFNDRFGCYPALWHSGLTAAQRRLTWRGVAQGTSRVVVGARSALFLPYQKLGLIIVDEEHDPAYKQEDGVRYHARDMAVVRAHLGQFPIVLVSATPSLETMQNVWDGKYEHLILPARFGGAQMPEIDLVDLREDKPDSGNFIAPSLKKAMMDTLQRGEQALMFLNRRGYAPLTLCRSCGHRMECPRCTAWLVEHKTARGAHLQCHHCGFGVSVPKQCPSCSDEGSLVPCGPGVERIEEEVRQSFPDARVMVLASDTTDSQDELRTLLERIRRKEVDIIIGTQIVAKGHHFPDLTLVGVIDADLGLQGGELRASERVYQLLHQVAGRAGRAEKPGHVYLQTYMPQHRIMQALAAAGRDAFLQAEAAEREAAHMPPFARLAGIIVTGRDEAQALGVAKALARVAPQEANVQTFGPAPAPMARLRGRYRFRLLVRAEKTINLQKTVLDWVNSIKVPSTVRHIIDIDPQSFM